MTRRALAACIVLAQLALPAAASAHILVEEARDRYRDADFDRAMELLDRAEAADDLAPEDVEELLLTRALVHFARGSEDAMRLDAERLMSIGPDYELGKEVPPSVREVAEAARERVTPLALEGTIERTAEGARFSLEITGEPRGLLRRTAAACRVDGGEWKRTSSRSLQVQADEGAAVECFAHLVGPGGATIARAGSATDPIRQRLEPWAPSPEQTAALAGGPGRGPPPEEDPGALPWVLGGVGAAVVVAAVTVLALALSAGPNDQTVVEAPSL